jgi:hypothetical protein
MDRGANRSNTRGLANGGAGTVPDGQSRRGFFSCTLGPIIALRYFGSEATDDEMPAAAIGSAFGWADWLDQWPMKPKAGRE